MRQRRNQPGNLSIKNQHSVVLRLNEAYPAVQPNFPYVAPVSGTLSLFKINTSPVWTPGCR